MPQGARQVVLHVTESFGAGTATAILQFADAAPEVEHHLLRRVRPGSETEIPAGVFASVHDLPVDIGSALAVIRTIANGLAPDVIHAHSSIGGALVRMAVRNRPDRRIVYSPHCYAFQRLDRPLVKRAVFALIEWALARNTDTVTACSKHEAVLAKRINPSGRTVFLPNAVPGARPTSVASDVVTVFTVGRVGPQKDPTYFLRVVERLRAHSPVPVRLRWIGGGDADATALLERAGVEVTGWCSDPWASVAADDVYLHTAAWEGFPFAVLEAFAHDHPLVVRRIPTFAGMPAAEVHEAPDRLAARILQLVRSQDHRERNKQAWRDALAANTTEEQRQILLTAYGPMRSLVAAG